MPITVGCSCVRGEIGTGSGNLTGTTGGVRAPGAGGTSAAAGCELMPSRGSVASTVTFPGPGTSSIGAALTGSGAAHARGAGATAVGAASPVASAVSSARITTAVGAEGAATVKTSAPAAVHAAATSAGMASPVLRERGS